MIQSCLVYVPLIYNHFIELQIELKLEKWTMKE